MIARAASTNLGLHHGRMTVMLGIAQGGELLDRLMRRAVFPRPNESCVKD